MAVNSPIQGSAADLIKVAMINVHKRLHVDLPHTKMILQVHDELIFEVPDKELEEATKLVKQISMYPEVPITRIISNMRTPTKIFFIT